MGKNQHELQRPVIRTAALACAVVTTLAVVSAAGPARPAAGDPITPPPELSLTASAASGAVATGAEYIEGGVTDGTYWYVVGHHLQSNDPSQPNLQKYTTSVLTKVKLWSDSKGDLLRRTYAPGPVHSVTELPTNNDLGHGNDVAYDPQTNQLLIPSWDNDESVYRSDQNTRIQVVDAKTLRIVGSLEAPIVNLNLCYDSVNHRYAGGVSARTLFTSHQIQGRNLVPDKVANTPYPGTPQGIDCDANYIYLTTSDSTAAATKQVGNRIYVLDWNFKLVATYAYTSGSTEIEHLTHAGATFYVGVNDHLGATVRNDLYRADNFQYQVVYRAGGGQGTMAPTTVPYGMSTPLRANSLTRAGYYFAGWTATRTSDGKTLYGDPNNRATPALWFTPGSSDIPAGWQVYVYADQQAVAKGAPYGQEILTAQWVKD